MAESTLFKIINKYNSDDFVKEVALIQFSGDKDFWVRENGIFGVVLDGLLIDNSLGEILETYVPEQIKLFPTKVHRRATGETWDNYSGLELYYDLDLEDFDKPAKNFEGLKIFWFMESIYVSAALKNIIEKNFIKIDDLDFDNSKPLVV